MFSLILLRGLPGAGKSTIAEILSENKWPVFSIDNYFTDPQTGKYSFEYEKNHLAYKKCSDSTENEMIRKTEKIFVDNTFTLEWEMDIYFALSAKHGYRVYVLTVENRHKGKNVHNISDEQVKKMAEKYKVVLFS
jgi:predicted kinase